MFVAKAAEMADGDRRIVGWPARDRRVLQGRRVMPGPFG
jgi:hypothetical protein